MSSADKLLSELDALYGSQQFGVLEARLLQLKSDSSQDELSHAVIYMFQGFLRPPTIPTEDLIRGLRIARETFQACDQPHNAARCLMGVVRILNVEDRPDEAIDVGLQAIEELEELDDLSRACRIRSWMANMLLATGRANEAVATVVQAIDEALQLDNKSLLRELLTTSAWVNARIGEQRLAIDHADRAIDVAEQINDVDGLISSLSAKSIILRMRAEYEGAIECGRRAIGIAEAQPYAYPEMANLYNNLATALFSVGQIVEAYELFLRCLDLNPKRSVRAISHNNLGNVFMIVGDSEEAINQYRHGIEEAGNDSVRVNVSSRLSLFAALLATDQQDEAATMLDEVDRILNTSQLPFEQVVAELYRARLLFRRSLTAEAIKVATRVRDHFVATDNVEEYLDASTLIAEATVDTIDIEELDHLYALATDRRLANARLDIMRIIRSWYEGRGLYKEALEAADEIARQQQELYGERQARRRSMIESERRVAAERMRSEQQQALLHSMLPATVAERLLQGERVADHFDSVSVLFMDIVGFTQLSTTMQPAAVVELLRSIFAVCDDVANKHGMTRIKTIGDSYMAATGVPEPLTDHAQRAARAACDIMMQLRTAGMPQIRIGIHCGPVVAGIVGEERLQYDVWGDTVNVASRMESTGEAGRIQVSEAFAQELGARSEELGAESEELGAESEELGGSGLRSLASALRSPLSGLRYPVSGLRERGSVEVKGKGVMRTYWLEADTKH